MSETVAKKAHEAWVNAEKKIPSSLESFSNELDYDYYSFKDEADDIFESKVKMVWLKTWYCTDTNVGVAAHFYEMNDGVPLLLCVTTQSGRKEDEWYHWAVHRSVIKNLMDSLPKRDRFSLVSLDINENFDSFCNRTGCN